MRGHRTYLLVENFLDFHLFHFSSKPPLRRKGLSRPLQPVREVSTTHTPSPSTTHLKSLCPQQQSEASLSIALSFLVQLCKFVDVTDVELFLLNLSIEVLWG